MPQLVHLLFSFRGRLSRRGWWLGQSLVLATALALTSVPALLQLPPQWTGTWQLLPLLLIVPELAIITKRLHDRGRSFGVIKAVHLGLVAAAMIMIPVPTPLIDVSSPALLDALALLVLAVFLLWLIVENGLRPGTPGPNRYGPHPAAWTALSVNGPDPQDLAAVPPRARWLLNTCAVVVCMLALSVALAPVFGTPDLLNRGMRPFMPTGTQLAIDRRANTTAIAAYDAGRAAATAGDDAGAIGQFGRAIEHYGANQPTAAEAYRARAAAHLRLGQRAAALADYDQATRLEPDHSGGHRSRGDLLLAVGRPADALRDYDRALALSPDFARAALGRADALARLDRGDDAIEAYRQAIRAADKDHERHLRLARDDAQRARTRADRDELIVLAHVSSATLLRDRGRPAEALDALGEAMRIRPNHWRVYVSRGWLHEQAGELARARADYAHAASLRAPDAWLRQALERTQAK